MFIDNAVAGAMIDDLKTIEYASDIKLIQRYARGIRDIISRELAQDEVSVPPALPMTGSTFSIRETTEIKPFQAYKCQTCSNTNLDSRDLEVNPATGNIWGCNKCGGKTLEPIAMKDPLAYADPTPNTKNPTTFNHVWGSLIQQCIAQGNCSDTRICSVHAYAKYGVKTTLLGHQAPDIYVDPKTGKFYRWL